MAPRPEEDDGGVSIRENTGRWTTEEHDLFLQGLSEYDKQWKLIANLIRTRTVVQIRTHAQKYFQKMAKARQSPTAADESAQDSGSSSDTNSVSDGRSQARRTTNKRKAAVNAMQLTRGALASEDPPTPRYNSRSSSISSRSSSSSAAGSPRPRRESVSQSTVQPPVAPQDSFSVSTSMRSKIDPSLSLMLGKRKSEQQRPATVAPPAAPPAPQPISSFEVPAAAYTSWFDQSFGQEDGNESDSCSWSTGSQFSSVPSSSDVMSLSSMPSPFPTLLEDEYPSSGLMSPQSARGGGGSASAMPYTHYSEPLTPVGDYEQPFKRSCRRGGFESRFYSSNACESSGNLSQLGDPLVGDEAGLGEDFLDNILSPENPYMPITYSALTV